MNIVLNFLPLKRGGGVQVGLDFINQAKCLGHKHNWYLVATESTPFADLTESTNFKVSKIVPNSLYHRLRFEFYEADKLVNSLGATVVYTQFGPHWPFVKARNIVGCAYSNLMYPELDFWSKLPLHSRVKKNIIDRFRLSRMKAADAVIFETDDLKRRAIQIHGISEAHAYFVKPSVSSLVSPDAYHAETVQKCQRIPSGFRVLMLSGYHPNKNIELLPRIAAELMRNKNIDNIIFVTTLPVDHPGTQKIYKYASELGVQDLMYNLGPIPPNGCADAYKVCSAVILPSRLESFSNNIAETWVMEKPLLMCDFDWSRELCGEGAVYFQYDNAEDAAEKLHCLANDNVFRNSVIEKGRNTLATYPKSSERFLAYQKIIERYAE